MTTTRAEPLYDSIGGDYTINAAVDSYYEKVLGDDRINSFFEGVCMNTQIGKLKSFLQVAFGKKRSYAGRSLKEVHAPMVENGLCDEHVDIIIGHMTETLKELHISEDLIAEAVESINSYRDEVLGRAS